ncbi:MAG: hypothetical protein ABIQ73_04160, partial [Acidimicrobiales bacterium]
SEWDHLRSDVIAHGQPAQRTFLHPKQAVTLGGGMFVAETTATRLRFRKHYSVVDGWRDSVLYYLRGATA